MNSIIATSEPEGSDPRKRALAELVEQILAHLQHDRFGEALTLIDAASRLDEKMMHLPFIRWFEPDWPLLRSKLLGLSEAGCCFPSLSDFLAKCATQLGDYDAVKSILDYDRFVQIERLEPIAPEERALLLQEFAQDLTMFGPRGKPSRLMLQRLRMDEGREDLPATARLLARMRKKMEEYRDALEDADQSLPFVANRPREFHLRGWSVISGRDSHHARHFHQRSWANGVYYIDIPANVRDAPDHAGWLQIGSPDPEPIFSDAHGWSKHLLCPENDMLVIMPGHFWHETRPIGVDQLRIAFGFDVIWKGSPVLAGLN